MPGQVGEEHHRVAHVFGQVAVVQLVLCLDAAEARCGGLTGRVVGLGHVALSDPQIRLGENVDFEGARDGETLVVVGSRAEAETFPYGFFSWWLLDGNTGTFSLI